MSKIVKSLSLKLIFYVEQNKVMFIYPFCDPTIPCLIVQEK